MTSSKKYQIRDLKDSFGIFETQTKQIIQVLQKKYDAVTLQRHLNSGGGFNGETPMFMLNGWNQTKK